MNKEKEIKEFLKQAHKACEDNRRNEKRMKHRKTPTIKSELLKEFNQFKRKLHKIFRTLFRFGK
ncbi:uncharacterized protein METZ01_LOCUS138645 [marine metagenome]|uniref:Uncharacterized protein n=1 Tax=marine metagenome TaxID=408172 RepID=A0A381ZA11_9ZZZZ